MRPEEIPEDLDEFLLWLKERTEAAWATLETRTLEDYESTGQRGPSWKQGTKWQQGLEAQQIDALEERWQVRFPADYRRFLGLLNAPDRPMVTTAYRGNSLYLRDDCPSFYDWQRDEEAITWALEKPLRGLLFDVEKASLWLDSWGPKPHDSEVRDRLASLLAAAPKLTPVYGHRYILEETPGVGSPVFSIWQSDIIIYGYDLRDYLLKELQSVLKLGLEGASTREFDEASFAAIPFWGELLFHDT